MLADRWDVPSCVSACLTHLAKKQLDGADDINALHALASLDIMKAHRGPLLRACQAGLARHFGKVQAVLNRADKMKAFCKLSFSAVKEWAALDGPTSAGDTPCMETDSEDSVAMLITHWWKRNAQALGLDTQAGMQLTLQLRILRTSTCFMFGVLPDLPWIKFPRDTCRLVQYLHQHPAPNVTTLPPAWTAPARACQSTRDVSAAAGGVHGMQRAITCHVQAHTRVALGLPDVRCR